MGDRSKIEWTDATWNPVTGCTPVSAGCANCYAKREHDRRHKAFLAGRKMAPQYAKPFENVQLLWTDRLDRPLCWRKPRRIFVCSGSDLFHEDVPFPFIDKVFAIMATASRHTFIVLTKRPRRMHTYLTNGTVRGRIAGAWRLLCGHPVASREAQDEYTSLAYQMEHKGYWPLPNVHVGVSVEDKSTLYRVELLMQTPAAVRFVSYEPALGPVDFSGWLCQPDKCIETCTDTDVCPFRTLDSVICGGESGPDGRPMHPDWARKVRDDCASAGVPFFFKQWGAWTPEHQRLVKIAGGLKYNTRSRYSPETLTFFPDGTRYDAMKPDQLFDPHCVMMYRVGKKNAGRVLDGRVHDDLPGQRQSQNVVGSGRKRRI